MRRCWTTGPDTSWGELDAVHHATRDLALELAYLRHGLDASYGRELDKLPADVLAAFEAALMRSLDREELSRALAETVELVLRESSLTAKVPARMEPSFDS